MEKLTKEQEIERNKELIKRFPWLMPRNRWTDKIPEDFDYSYTELDAMPDGWRDAFGIEMCEKIQSELEKFGYVDKFRITQIKEKYGGLRFYTGGVPIGKLSDEPDRVVELDECRYPECNHKIEYWKYDGKKGEKYIFSHYIILEKCNIDSIISEYEEKSYNICISCGEKATRVSLGYISPWCDECASKLDNFKTVAIEEYYSDEE